MPNLKPMVGRLLLIWRLYYIVRVELIRRSNGLVTDELFGILMQALTPKALEPFDVRELKHQIKDDIIPFLENLALSVKTFKTISEKNNGGNSERAEGTDAPGA